MRFLLPFLLLALSGCLGPRVSFGPADMELLAPWSQEHALRMELIVLNGSNKDLNRVQLELKVTNISTNVLILDREVAAGFNLRFRTDLSERFVYSAERDVSSEETRRLPKPGTNAANTRFVALRPGESLSRSYDLSKPIRSVCQGHWSDREMVHHGFYYEADVLYRVPKRAKKLLIDVWYERGVWWTAADQFEQWHGRSAESIGLWGGRAGSNSVVVEGR
jgi:hypothetical protein